MIELLTLVSLWCSQPNHTRLSAYQVDECRKLAIDCIFLWDKNSIELSKCFLKIKLNDL